MSSRQLDINSPWFGDSLLSTNSVQNSVIPYNLDGQLGHAV